MLFGLVLALVLIYNMINIAIQNKFSPLFKITVKAVFITNWCHKASLSHLHFFKVVSTLANFGLKFIIICLKTSLILSSSTSTIFLLLSKISTNGLSPLYLQHIVSSCKSYLQDGRYTWRHNSVLLHIAKTLSSIASSSLYADLPIFPSPSLITGDSLRPDLVLMLNNASVYVREHCWLWIQHKTK